MEAGEYDPEVEALLKNNNNDPERVQAHMEQEMNQLHAKIMGKGFSGEEGKDALFQQRLSFIIPHFV